MYVVGRMKIRRPYYTYICMNDFVSSTFVYDEYAVQSGTSMAAPHMAGAAALYDSRHPSESHSEFYNVIMSLARLTRRNMEVPYRRRTSTRKKIIKLS